MDDPTPADPRDPDGTPGSDGPPDSDEAAEERTDRRAALVIVAALVLAAAVALVVWLVSDDEDAPVTTTTATSDAPGTTATSAPTSSTESTFAPSLDDEQLASVVWPDVGSSRRFDDPVAATHAFATEYLAFVDPVVGESAQGAESTEVQVRPTADGPPTTVQLSQFGDDSSWWVLGASAEDIQVTSPAAGDLVTSPLQPTGSSRAFEGTVDVEVRVDGDGEPVGAGFVTGGATEELAEFSGEIDFDPAGASWGAVVFRTISAEDGRTWEATVVRVAFSEG